MLTKKELREYILIRYDPDDILEILDFTTEELLVYLLDVCYEKQKLFVDEDEIWMEND